jgi:sulfatase maturation enzyme AslB (radical SAM superfamily)
MRQNAYGAMAPCCFGAGEWDLAGMPAREKFFAEPWERMREIFLDGGKPIECSRCWFEEEAGKKSMRQIFLEERKDAVSLVESGAWRRGPVIVQVKTSNVCNLACKTCWGTESTKFGREAEYYETEYQPIDNYLKPPAPSTHVSEADFRDYGEFSDNLETVDFFGGEPLLNKTHWVLLKGLIERGRSREVGLYYSTNATLYPSDELIAMWKQFKSIKIGFSIDGIDAGFHYVRWPGDFAGVSENIDRIRDELRPELERHGVRVELAGAPTCSIYNVYSIGEVYDWLKTKLGGGVYVTLVQGPRRS